MSRHEFLRHGRRMPLFAAVAVCLLGTISGCGRDDGIRRYQVSKKDRMLAAIVPQGQQNWFFKLTGPNQSVKDRADEFISFINSIKFTDAGEGNAAQGEVPTWELPAGWRQQPSKGMRFATLLIGDADAPLELTVIPLPSARPSSDEVILSNVNRWRGQIGLSPLTAKEYLNEETPPHGLSRVNLADGTEVVAVNLAGNLTGGGGMQAPFAGTGGPATAPQRPQVEPRLSYDVPATWKEIEPGQMQDAAFVVEDGDQTAKISISGLPGNAGGIIANINRWCRQINLPALSKEEIEARVEQSAIGGSAGLFIELTSPESSTKQETILGALTFHNDKTWFFKLRGNSGLAESEKPNFLSFLRSVKFPARRGDQSG